MLNEVGKIASPPTRILYPLDEAAILLGMSRSKLYVVLGEKKITSCWNGGRHVIHIDAINSYASSLPTEKPDFAGPVAA